VLNFALVPLVSQVWRGDDGCFTLRRLHTAECLNPQRGMHLRTDTTQKMYNKQLP
jgi:hypothetical protein